MSLGFCAGADRFQGSVVPVPRGERLRAIEEVSDL